MGTVHAELQLQETCRDITYAPSLPRVFTVHNAVIHLGHQNGCVILWTPNLPHPAVQILAHLLGPATSVAVDPSEGGRYMASAGRDGSVYGHAFSLHSLQISY